MDKTNINVNNLHDSLEKESNLNNKNNKNENSEENVKINENLNQDKIIKKNEQSKKKTNSNKKSAKLDEIDENIETDETEVSSFEVIKTVENKEKTEKVKTNKTDLTKQVNKTDETKDSDNSKIKSLEFLLKENKRTDKDRFFLFILVAINYILLIISKIIGLLHKTKQHELPPVDESLLLLSATEITKRIKNNTLKSEHIVRTYINRILSVQKKINAVVDCSFTEAINTAKTIDKNLQDPALASKLKQLPLLGVPFTCKNSIAIKGLAFDSGSLYRKGIKAEEDAQVIKNLRNAGAIPLALTNVPELVLWWDTDNKVYGRTCNPYDLSRISGGSSGGEGALIASAGSLVGVGSDVAGSIRIPSMFNGIFGHKTTSKYIPVTGMFPESPETCYDFVSFGPLCRYAVDLPLFFNAMSGGRASELQLDKPVDFKNIKIYYMENDGGNPLSSSVDERILKKMHLAITHFSKKYNAEVEKINISKFKYGLLFFGTSFGKMNFDFAELSTSNQGRINLIRELIKSVFGLSKNTLAILVQNINVCLPICNKESEIYKKLVNKLNNLRSKIHELLGEDAVLFYPTWPTIAPKHQTTILRGFEANYTAIFNALSIPATHVPMGLTEKEGLPIGFTIAAGPGQDRLNLAFAKEIEKEFGGWVCPS